MTAHNLNDLKPSEDGAVEGKMAESKVESDQRKKNYQDHAAFSKSEQNDRNSVQKAR